MWIECAERLVQQQHARPPRQRPSERDALPLAARQPARLLLREVRDPEPVEQPVGRTAAERDVLLDAQVREERVVLEHEPDGALLGADVDAVAEPDVVAAANASARRRHEARDRTQHRRLPRARRPDERDRLAGDVER